MNNPVDTARPIQLASASLLIAIALFLFSPGQHQGNPPSHCGAPYQFDGVLSCDHGSLKALRHICPVAETGGVDYRFSLVGSGCVLIRQYVDAKLALNLGLKLDVNAAPVEALVGLPNLGRVTAQRIVEGRPYGHLEDLLRIRGVGPERLRIFKAGLEVREPISVGSSEQHVP